MSGNTARRERWLIGLLCLFAAGCTVAMVWGWAWRIDANDYATEARMPLDALLHGHFLRFLQTAPSYGGSLELRAPFAMIASLAGGGARLVYRFSALPCVLALGALGVWAAVGMRRARVGWVAVIVAVLVCVANPLTYYALAIGHPEELLGGVLCVCAVLAARAGRPGIAGILLGAAIANKEWGLLAVGPVLIALETGRWRALLFAGAVAAVLVGPIAVAASSVAGGSGRLAVGQTGFDFYPQQIWWFIGTQQHWVPAMAGQLLRGFRHPPGWLSQLAHPLIIWLAVPATLLAARRRIGADRALLLLALLFLERCMLDPWDLVYYPIPLVIAVFGWETVVARRAPLGAGALAVATALIFKLAPDYLAANEQALVFIVPAVAVLVALVLATYRHADGHEGATALADPPAHSTTIRSFGKWLRRSAPAAVTTTRSSIRTPS